jgi:hypothetical protein
MLRVWLTPWEWACCGTPFAAGDEVELHVDRDAERTWFVAHLGAELAGTIDAVESHHEDGGPEPVRGRVRAIHAAIGRERVRRVPRARRPREDEPFVVGAAPDGLVVRVGAPREPYTLASEPIPGPGRLHPLDRVPPGSPEGAEGTGGAAVDPPFEGERDALLGYLVDLVDLATNA